MRFLALLRGRADARCGGTIKFYVTAKNQRSTNPFSCVTPFFIPDNYSWRGFTFVCKCLTDDAKWYNLREVRGREPNLWLLHILSLPWMSWVGFLLPLYYYIRLLCILLYSNIVFQTHKFNPLGRLTDYQCLKL